MNVYICSKIAKSLQSNESNLDHLQNVINDEHVITFRWPSLLSFLDIEDLFISEAVFDDNHPIFAITVETISQKRERAEVEHIFDSLFAETLRRVKELKQVDPLFLLKRIAEQRSTNHLYTKHLDQSLSCFINDLTTNSTATIHGLVLELAWDRMCVRMKHLFDYQSTNEAFNFSINILQECLIESYFHIISTGRSQISFYKLLEALAYFHLRQENINKHTDEQWQILSKNISTLGNNDLSLSNVFYVDDIFKENQLSDTYLTLDSPETIFAKNALANCLLEKLPTAKTAQKKNIQSVSMICAST